MKDTFKKSKKLSTCIIHLSTFDQMLLKHDGSKPIAVNDRIFTLHKGNKVNQNR